MHHFSSIRSTFNYFFVKLSLFQRSKVEMQCWQTYLLVKLMFAVCYFACKMGANARCCMCLC